MKILKGVWIVISVLLLYGYGYAQGRDSASSASLHESGSEIVSEQPPPETAETEDSDITSRVPDISDAVIKLEVIDRTAGRSLTAHQIQTITYKIIEQFARHNPSVIISAEARGEIAGVLRVNIDVFRLGNKAQRFWLGFGAGKAHFRITTEWLDGETFNIVDTRNYQRFGAKSVRSDSAIEQRMIGLIAHYCREFVSGMIN